MKIVFDVGEDAKDRVSLHVTQPNLKAHPRQLRRRMRRAFRDEVALLCVEVLRTAGFSVRASGLPGPIEPAVKVLPMVKGTGRGAS